MISLSKIIKADAAIIDNNNKVSIASAAYIAAPETDKNAFSPEDIDRIEEQSRRIIDNANMEAERRVQEAQRESAAMIADARERAEEEAKAIKARAREEGYNEGRKKAEAEGRKIKAEADTVLANAKKEREDMEASLEPDIVDLIIKITAKLLDNVCKLDPLVVVNLVRQGMAEATLTGDVTVHVSPHDFEQVAENKDRLLALTDGSVHLEIVRDLSLNEADCVIETPFGNIDCSLGQQFDTLRQNLTYILQGK